jgi:excisionase family DNA binding protein
MQEHAHYTALEVAAFYRVDPSTVRRWADKGLIPAIKTPGGGKYRFPKSEIDQLLSIGMPAEEEQAAEVAR